MDGGSKLRKPSATTMGGYDSPGEGPDQDQGNPSEHGRYSGKPFRGTGGNRRSNAGGVSVTRAQTGRRAGVLILDQPAAYEEQHDAKSAQTQSDEDGPAHTPTRLHRRGNRGVVDKGAPQVGRAETDGECGAALYLRVSTEDQDLAGQERELRVECARRGWGVVAVYGEKVTGTGKVERREYERLLGDARKPDRPWTHLLVWSLDRWSREERFSRAVAAIEDLEAAGVRFHSLHEPTLDSSEDGTANMGRDLLRAILPVIASFESRRKSERVRVAMREIKEGRRATRSGRPPGRPVRATPEKVREAARLHDDAVPWAEVAQRTGLKAETARRAVLRLKKAAGAAHNSPPRETVSATPEGG